MTSRARSSVAAAVLVLVALLIGTAVTATTTATAATTSSLRIGSSVQGRPIEVACLGAGEHSVLVVGGLHTGPEAHSSDLALELAWLAWSGELAIPDDTQLCILPTLNPDGVALGTRTNANGVDLNRNWPSWNWTPDAYHPEGGAVSGGSKALSEPETRALWNYIQQTKPSVVLVLHCCGAVVEANDGPRASELADAYGAGAAMQHIAHWTAYTVTGQFIDAMDRIGIAAIDVEMAELDAIALDDHRDGIEALLRSLSGTPPVSHADGARTTAPAAPAASAGPTYRIRAGDTLANIAVHHGTTATRLARLNNLLRPDLIEVGQLLRLPR